MKNHELLAAITGLTVSTKYLNRYLAMFAIREMLHEDTQEEMMDRLLQKLRLVETNVVTADLQSINLLQV